MKINTCHVDHLDWRKPEWADDNSQALVAYHAGYELEIGPAIQDPKKWDWLCKMTAEISETPEVVDTGTAASVSGAKRGAGTAANNDMRRRAKEAAQRKQEPEPEPKPKTAGELLEAVEEQVAQAIKPESKRRRPRQPVAA